MRQAPWLMLAAFVVVRTCLGLQFQSIGSLGSLLMHHLAIDYAALGMLIGAYHFPGVFAVLPVGWLNARYGDRRLTLGALSVMTFGAFGLALSPGFGSAITARVIGGIGAACLNTVLTKMAMDRFRGASLTLAIGFLMGAWPLGQALALVSLPPVAAMAGWRLALGSIALLCAAGLLAMVMLMPRDGSATETPQRLWLNPGETLPLVAAGITWAGFNAAMIIILGFAPAYFVGHGMSATGAGSLVSLMSLPLIVLIPLGGWLARFTRRPLLTIAGFLLAVLITVLALPIAGEPAPTLLLLGVLMGSPVALMMSLPAEVLSPDSRAIGMGWFYLVYNAIVAVLPVAAGWVRDTSGVMQAPFYVAGACLMLALATLAGYGLLMTRRAATVPA